MGSGFYLPFTAAVVRICVGCGGSGRGRGRGEWGKEEWEGGEKGLRCDIWIAEGAAMDVEDCIGGVVVVGSGRGRGGGEVEVEGAEGEGG